MQIRISAIICTYNRADLLAGAIESLAGQTLSNTDYEILVVDNGSIDKTPRLVQEKQQKIPNLKYIREDTPGLSRARNRGIASSRGNVTAYVDDDAVAGSTWLENILRIFDTVQPKPGLVCGPVEPIWGGPRPDWLKDDLLDLYSVLNRSNFPRQLQDTEWILGTNMAIPRDVIQDCGEFDENLGRKGESLLCGEETALTNRIRTKGYSVYYDPAIVVRHYIHPARLSKIWFYKRKFWGGVTRGIRERHENSGPGPQFRNAVINSTVLSKNLWFGGKSLLDPDRRLRLTGNILSELGHLYSLLL